VYLYPGMTHVKAGLVDGCWAYIGTGNFDKLSLRHNYEVGLAICAGPVLQELEQRVFVADCQPDWEMHAPLPVSCCDWCSELLCSLCL